MGRGSETAELGVATVQAKGAEARMSGTAGLKEQHRHMRLEWVELFIGRLFCLLLFVSLMLLVIDRQMAVYAVGTTGIFALAYIAMKTRNVIAIRKKRAEDLRRMASEKDKTNETTEANNA